MNDYWVDSWHVAVAVVEMVVHSLGIAVFHYCSVVVASLAEMYNKKMVVLNSSSRCWRCCRAFAGSRLGEDSTDWLMVVSGTDTLVLAVEGGEGNSPSFPAYNTEVSVRRMLRERRCIETFVFVAVIWKR